MIPDTRFALTWMSYSAKWTKPTCQIPSPTQTERVMALHLPSMTRTFGCGKCGYHRVEFDLVIDSKTSSLTLSNRLLHLLQLRRSLRLSFRGRKFAAL